MATTGVINSTIFSLYINDSGTYKEIACLTDVSISQTQEIRDTTCKSNASVGYRSKLPSLKDWNGSFSGLFRDTDVESASFQAFSDLQTAFANDTELTVRFMTNVSGDTYYEGTCYIESLEINSAGVADNVTYSGSLAGTGNITTGSVT